MATEATAPRVSERYARPLFLLTILTGSFLLFLTQPMIARMALPRLGGAPAVWNSAMLVYQALLLAGYAYAHYLSRLRPRRQAGVHVVLFALAALWLPIGLSEAQPSGVLQPAFWVPWFLLSSIGPLFFIVSAQAPLMQRWYALETSRGDPYPLYAASNLGSFAGLISYPLLVEPLMTLQQQSWLWTAVYALLVLLVALLRADRAGPCRRGRARGNRARSAGAPGASLDRARGGAVGADAVDDDPPHHRHRRHALAVGAAARPLSAELRRRLRRASPSRRLHHRARAAGDPGRGRPGVQQRHPEPLLLGDARAVPAVRRGGGPACRAVPPPPGGRPSDAILSRHVVRRHARRSVLRDRRASAVRLGL